MSDYLLYAHELVDTIENLTNQMEVKIQQNEYEEVNTIIASRFEIVAKLISLATTKTDQELLIEFLVKFQHRDNVLMQIVQQEHDRVQKALSNIKNLEEYVNF